MKSLQVHQDLASSEPVLHPHGPFSLMNLPAEVRNAIYDHCAKLSGPSTYPVRSPTGPAALYNVSRQVRKEFLSFYAQHITSIRLGTTTPFEILNLSPVIGLALPHIQTVTVVYHPHEYNCDERHQQVLQQSTNHGKTAQERCETIHWLTHIRPHIRNWNAFEKGMIATLENVGVSQITLIVKRDIPVMCAFGCCNIMSYWKGSHLKRLLSQSNVDMTVRNPKGKLDYKFQHAGLQ